MPRLGEGTADAYPERNNNNAAKFFRMGCILFMIFFLRNLLLRDYRGEEIDVLRKSGLSQEKIEEYVPPTTTERISKNKKKLSEYEQLKEDMATLKEEMKMIKEKLGLMVDENDKPAASEDKKDTEGASAEKR